MRRADAGLLTLTTSCIAIAKEESLWNEKMQRGTGTYRDCLQKVFVGELPGLPRRRTCTTNGPRDDDCCGNTGSMPPHSHPTDGEANEQCAVFRGRSRKVRRAWGACECGHMQSFRREKIALPPDQAPRSPHPPTTLFRRAALLDPGLHVVRPRPC